jgi:hypothetical protein
MDLFAVQDLVNTVSYVFDCVVSMPYLQQLSWVVTDETMGSLAEEKLPLKIKEDDATERKEVNLTLDELQDLLCQRLPHTNVQVTRLPEYSTNRYSLSVSQED